MFEAFFISTFAAEAAPTLLIRTVGAASAAINTIFSNALRLDGFFYKH